MKKINQKQFPPESAGRKMTTRVPVVYLDNKISDIRDLLYKEKRKLETINYIYVLNSKNELSGVISIKDIFRKPEGKKAKELIKRNLVKVRPHTDQEKVAILSLKHNLKAIPVVDKNNKFLGIVPSDVILDILYSEDLEDFLKAAGIHSPIKKLLNASPWYLFKAKIPWLILGLTGGILSAKVVSFFESSLKSYFLLAVFIPLILYVGSAVGSQTETLFVRSLVINSDKALKKYFRREFKVSAMIGVVLGTLLSLISIFIFGAELPVGLVLGFTLFLTIQSGVLIGLVTPWTFYRLGKDPAVASGPFGTIIRDISSLLIYFLVSFFLLQLL